MLRFPNENHDWNTRSIPSQRALLQNSFWEKTSAVPKRTDQIFHIAFRSNFWYYQCFLLYSASTSKYSSCVSSREHKQKMSSCISLMCFFHADKSFPNKGQQHTCKVLWHRKLLACIYLESNSCLIKSKSLQNVTSSTNHYEANPIQQKLLV